MNPKEKAKELVEKFYQNAPELFGSGKALSYAQQCALIAVNEIDKAEYNILINFGIVTKKYKSNYWKLVKQEIEKL